MNTLRAFLNDLWKAIVGPPRKPGDWLCVCGKHYAYDAKRCHHCGKTHPIV